ncbi:SDR family NAD(P)-dependent oxidoreductase [Aquirufa echingensis]|uniref:SDR family oxidoreductase n=1 Tax=Aquirufa echingensis TaxID=3096516 RepID=A0ABW6D0G6_9BACT
MQFDFRNKIILITGGTRGIGKQVADDLYSLGATVLITGTNPKEVKTLNEAAEKGSKKKIYFAVDFLKPESVNQFLKEVKKYNRIDGLVNNAGINRLNPIQNAQVSDWDDMLNVNLTSPFLLLNAISPIMIQNGYGRIVNISSIFGVISKEKRSVYSATKFGIHGLTVGCSNDLARYNVLVNTVSPGFVLTDLTKKNLTKTEMATLSEIIPIKRMAETKDISNVVVFLLSNLNHYLTGQNIVVDGGYTNV